MRNSRLFLFLIIPVALTSCKTYELTRYKPADLDKIKDISKYKVYIQTPKNTFEVSKPTLTKTGVTGDVSAVKDQAAREEIKNPKTQGDLKKHKNDMNFFTKTEIADTVKSANLKRADINEYSLVVVHSGANWKKVGEDIAGGLGVAVGLAALGGVVYWMTLNPW